MGAPGPIGYFTAQDVSKLMRKLVMSLAFVVAACAWAETGHAQAVRTWVASKGDDANPCSDAAPCKTFAGAAPKTAAQGEINCLGPGGYGSVTIIRSLTIDCESTLGGLIATSGIIVAAPGIVVNLRGLDLNAAGFGINGVSISAGATVRIMNSNIYGFSTAGINIAPATAGAMVVVTDTAIHNNAVGILLDGSKGSASVTLRNVVIDTSASHGVQVTTGGQAATAVIDRSMLALNKGNGLLVSGSSAVAVIGNSTVTGNATGVGATNGGTLWSFKNNQIGENVSDGTPIAAFAGPGGPLQ